MVKIWNQDIKWNLKVETLHEKWESLRRKRYIIVLFMDDKNSFKSTMKEYGK
jgi:hypothetical protein